MEPTFCEYYNRKICQSCTWLPISEEEQIHKKEEQLKAALSFLPSFEMRTTVRSPKKQFRNKAKFAVTGTVDQPVIGLTGPADDLDQGRELLNCPIHIAPINEVVSKIPALLIKYQITPYQIADKKGELKGLILFYSSGTNEMLLRFILRSPESVARLKKLTAELQQQFQYLKCVSANIQPVPHAILEGEEEIFITEQKHILQQLGNLKLPLAPKSFVQTNEAVASQLYQTAAEWIQQSGTERMIELFAGQGAFSFFAAQNVPELSVLGLEINPAAVRQANLTATALGMTHIKFEVADVNQTKGIMEQLRDYQSDLILVNPPRRGLSESVQLILESLPKHLIYSSCSWETLSKDLKILGSKYQLNRIQVFDIFPHTEHFETLVWLSKTSESI